METKRLLLIFAGMWAATYLPRYLPLAYFSRVRLSGRFLTWLSYLPVTILSALIFPSALMRDGALDAGLGNPSVWALLASFVAAVTSRSLIWTMLTGGAAVMFFRVVLAR